VFDYSIAQLTDFMAKEITVGIDGTEAKAGVLKAYGGEPGCAYLLKDFVHD